MVLDQYSAKLTIFSIPPNPLPRLTIRSPTIDKQVLSSTEPAVTTDIHIRVTQTYGILLEPASDNILERGLKGWEITNIPKKPTSLARFRL